MLKRILFYSFVFVLSLTAIPALAGEKDVLKELDDAMSEEKDGGSAVKSNVTQDEKDDIVSQLVRHFKGEIRFRGYYFTEPQSGFLLDPDKRDYEGETLLDYSTWVGRDFWSFHLGGWFEAGTQKDTYAGTGLHIRDKYRHRRYVELNELYLVLSAGNIDLTLGKKIFENGISTIYSPANFYHSFDLNDPLDPKTIGTWQSTLNYYRGDTTWTASIMPVYQPKKLPAIRSRWIDTGIDPNLLNFDPDALGLDWQVPDIGIGGGAGAPFVFNIMPGSLDEFLTILYYFGNLFFNGNGDDVDPERMEEYEGFETLMDLIGNRGVAVEERLPGADPGDYGWFGRVKSSLGMWDVFASSYYGPSFYPVLKYEDRGDVVALIKETPSVLDMAAGFSTTWENFEIHGEARYKKSIGNRDDSYINYVGGITFSEQALIRKAGLYDLHLTVEYAGEHITEEQDHPGYIIGSRYARIGRDDIFARASIGITEDLNLLYMADFCRWNRSRFQRFGASYRIMSGLVLGLSYEVFDGTEYSYFGRWKNNDRVIATLKWSF